MTSIKQMIILIPFGKAFVKTCGKNAPSIFRVSDSNIVKKEGIASMNKSMRVICNGIKGKGAFVKTQMIDKRIV